MSAINDSKRAIRDLVRERVQAIPAGARRIAAERICSWIAASSYYGSATQVLAYDALDDEVDLSGLLNAALAAGKRVYMPRVLSEGRMVFARWTPGDTQLSRFGVAEPVSLEPPLQEPSVCLVPGRAFDCAGNRLGRGGGFYDRAMAGLELLGATIGVAYECQVFAEVPVGLHDRPVAVLVTDTAVYGAAAG